ncbi:MAG: hypothetical protein IT308_05200 [Anaerolineaceae bacterium]|nr:hypothetical protein [Anaerolineaceae bacterium]
MKTIFSTVFRANRTARFAIQGTIVALLVLSLMLPIARPVQAAIPTFSIVSVVTDSTVTIQTYNFPAGQEFTVRMGAFGTLAIGGVVVGTVNSGAGGSFSATYAIPASLAGSAQIAIRMDSPAGYYAYNWFYNNTASGGTGGPVYTGIPTFNIVSVMQDDKVTIKTNNVPAGLNFTVRMGAYGTLALGGVVVGTTNSGGGGSFEATYSIPDSLKGSYRIAIRMDSTAGHYAYNWFYNNTSSGTGGPAYSGVPTFSILSVVQDSTVTIKANNFPAGLDFKVRMGAYGTLGIGGIEVATTNSGAGGSFEATYTIPASLAGSYQIAIRLESSAGYYAYNWFYNNTTSGGTGGPVYTGIPTFSIVSVVNNSHVTVQTSNLPPSQNFTVRMGPYGSLGIGGIEVATINSGAGGSQTFTFTIPAALYGSSQIAIRMDSPIGYYAFNWFYNTTT